jgi:hypothetical protein
MALGEKLFEESGNITGLKIIKVHPIEGVTTEIRMLKKGMITVSSSADAMLQ